VLFRSTHYFYNEKNIDEWVECKICGLRKPSIKKHILKHGLNSITYDGEFFSKNYKEMLEDHRIERRNTVFQFECGICHEKFSTQNALEKHIEYSKDIQHNHSINNETNPDNWMECKICGFRREFLDKHLKLIHNLEIKEYRQQYNAEVYSKSYAEKFKKYIMIGAHAPRKEKEKNFECSVCKEKFITEGALNHHIKFSYDKEHSSIFNNESNQDYWVECKICGYRSTRIHFHVNNIHKINNDEYKSKFGELFSKNYLDRSRENGMIKHESWRFEKEKNPFYQHSHSKESKKSISETLLSKKDSKKKNKILSEQTEKFENQKASVKDIFDGIENEEEI
jgi:Zn ribbon nucleic-acid-binding protein